MVKVITSDNFEQEVKQAALPVLLDFYADWCGPCKMMAPVLAKMAEKYQNRLIVGKLNVDENMEIAMEYHVSSIPYLVLFSQGQIEDFRVGAMPEAELEHMILRVLGEE